MRICYIITALIHGGAERLLVEVANRLVAAHHVHVVYFKGEPHMRARLDPRVSVHHVPLGWRLVRDLAALVRRLDPDVVHTHLGHADLVGLWATRKLPCRHICTMHNIWFKHDRRDRLFFAAYALLFRRIVPGCQVIAISGAVAEHVRDRLRVPDDRVHLIRNAVPQVELQDSRDAIRARLGIANDVFCILFVGRLSAQKSVDTLIRAAARLKDRLRDFTVLIVGEGAGSAELVRLSKELDVASNVQFRGVTDEPELYFAAADVFVLPSIFEGFSLVIVEAFRAGLPVIASRLEGPAELIEDGVNGLLFEPKDEAALADKILSLYRDQSLRHTVGRRGYEGYRGRYAIEPYVTSLAELYQRAPLGEKSGSRAKAER